MIVEISDLEFRYKKTPVLENISMTVDEREIVSLVGPNGSGKTTLLKCINRILTPAAGNILVDGKNVRKIRLKDMARFIGYVPQNTYSSFPLTVFETVRLGRTPHIDFRDDKHDKEIVFEVLELMGMEDMAFRMFNELSGGERQRVLIARAFTQEPRVLLLDEPTSNLDLKYQIEILELVVDMVNKKDASAIMAIHDMNMASQCSDKVIMLKNGKIHTVGEPATILNESNIRTVYGVKTTILENDGRPYVIPDFSIDRR